MSRTHALFIYRNLAIPDRKGQILVVRYSKVRLYVRRSDGQKETIITVKQAKKALVMAEPLGTALRNPCLPLLTPGTYVYVSETLRHTYVHLDVSGAQLNRPDNTSSQKKYVSQVQVSSGTFLRIVYRYPA